MPVVMRRGVEGPMSVECGRLKEYGYAVLPILGRKEKKPEKKEFLLGAEVK